MLCNAAADSAFPDWDAAHVERFPWIWDATVDAEDPKSLLLCQKRCKLGLL